tara:strand:+ start:314 stop:487 length:174 start_codon:yes stop_codon:yes gene_type:complete
MGQRTTKKPTKMQSSLSENKVLFLKYLKNKFFDNKYNKYRKSPKIKVNPIRPISASI